MGMGNYPQYADTVTEDFVKSICPDELEAFKEALDEADQSFVDFCREVSFDGADENTKVGKAYTALVKAFNKKTGLELLVVEHEADDRGDDLDGASFAVEGVYQLTPAGEKYQKEITRKCWNVFG